MKLTLLAIKQTCLQEGQGDSIKHNAQQMDFPTSKAKSELKAMELRQDSCIRGYHVIWNAVLGQVLLTEGDLAP